MSENMVKQILCLVFSELQLFSNNFGYASNTFKTIFKLNKQRKLILGIFKISHWMDMFSFSLKNLKFSEIKTFSWEDSVDKPNSWH